jgi:hypothetical protein
MGDVTQILPQRGRGTIRRMVEGHMPSQLSFRRSASTPVPLHQLRWSPSPFRGGISKESA